MHPVIRAASVAAFVVLSPSAHAEVCVRPDLISTFPVDGDAIVPPNAQLTAHYDPTAEYLQEDVTLTRDGGDPESMPVVWNSKEGLLTLTPPNALEPGATYVVDWPSLRGLGTASKGRGAKVSFTVGHTEDTASPTFAGLTHIDWDVTRERDDCTNGVEERFRFDLTPGAASDDSGTRSLALVVFQSRGGDVEKIGEPKQVLVTPLPSAGGAVSVYQSIDAASGNVCFAALVRDLTQKSSSGADKEVCAHATPPPFFYGCTVAAPRGASKGSTALSLVLIALSLRAMRRHRPAP